MLENEKLEFKVIRIGTAVSIILGPILLMIGFALHPGFPTVLNAPSDAATSLANIRANLFQVNLAHFIAFLGIPFLVIAALYLAILIFEEKPWFAIFGSILSIIGGVFMGGVFGFALSETAIAKVSEDQVAGTLPAFQILLDRPDFLFIMSLMAIMILLSFMVLSAGLFLTNKTPRWSSASIFLGSLIITIFVDIDPLMFIGAVFMLLGFFPIIKNLLQGENIKI